MNTQHIDTATEYLTSNYTAREYGSRLGYVAPETGEAILVGPESLDVLGRYLADGRADAYSRWCADAPCDERVDARTIATTITGETDLDALRCEAAAAGDMASVIGLDLLRDEIEAEVERLDGTLEVERIDGQIVVRDTDGGVWWPDDETAAALEAAANPRHAALLACREIPTAGRWRD